MPLHSTPERTPLERLEGCTFRWGDGVMTAPLDRDAIRTLAAQMRALLRQDLISFGQSFVGIGHNAVNTTQRDKDTRLAEAMRTIVPDLLNALDTLHEKVKALEGGALHDQLVAQQQEIEKLHQDRQDLLLIYGMAYLDGSITVAAALKFVAQAKIALGVETWGSTQTQLNDWRSGHE